MTDSNYEVSTLRLRFGNSCAGLSVQRQSDRRLLAFRMRVQAKTVKALQNFLKTYTRTATKDIPKAKTKLVEMIKALVAQA